jgi:hypothetical protein
MPPVSWSEVTMSSVSSQLEFSSTQAITASTASLKSICSSMKRPMSLAWPIQSTAPPSDIRKKPSGFWLSTLSAPTVIVASVGTSSTKAMPDGVSPSGRSSRLACSVACTRGMPTTARAVLAVGERLEGRDLLDEGEAVQPLGPVSACQVSRPPTYGMRASPSAGSTALPLESYTDGPRP